MENMFCPFCKGNDIREIDVDFEFTPIFQCFDCKKIFQVEEWKYNNKKELNPII